MEIRETNVEDLEAEQKFVDTNGDICTITVASFDEDAFNYSYAGCECCGVEEYYWIYFSRPEGSHGQYRLWKLNSLNVIVSE